MPDDVLVPELHEADSVEGPEDVAHMDQARRLLARQVDLRDVSRLELIALLLAIAFVLIAEMVNTAIEAAVDVASSSFDPMAKLAKDIGAGAVPVSYTHLTLPTN